MCSIFGYYKLKTDSVPQPNFVENALSLMRHRGPDFERSVQIGRVCLGHQRLSIIDTTAAAHQPMTIGAQHISFNGEIYNYLELRKSLLAGDVIQTSSDTEVLLLLLKKFGKDILNKLNGMFAFAYYDSARESLLLVRDRFGVKPLYYMIQDEVLYFSSEIKPLASIKTDIRRNMPAYQEFIQELATDFSEETHIEGIFQVKGGHYLTIRNGSVTSTEWYAGNDTSTDPALFSSKSDTVDYFEDLLTDAIRIRMRSDVPVSITLSGGLDSSLIYTLIKKRLNQGVRVYSFSHPGSNTDESLLVQKLVEPYGDSCRFIATSSNHNLDDWSRVVEHLEFPSWSFSALGYSDIFKEIAADGCRVVIEGHGSDEQLGGYPYLVEQAGASYAQRGEYWRSYQAFYLAQRMYGRNFWDIILSTRRLLSLIRSSRRGDFEGFEKAIRTSFHFKILPIVLRTFDRMSMMHSVESRAPYMDYRIVEFFRDLPIHYKVSAIGSKAILREVLKKHGVPFIYKQKKKQGFSSDEPVFLSNANTLQGIRSQVESLPSPEFSAVKAEAQKFLTGRTAEWDAAFPLSKASALAILERVYGFTV